MERFPPQLRPRQGKRRSRPEQAQPARTPARLRQRATTRTRREQAWLRHAMVSTARPKTQEPANRSDRRRRTLRPRQACSPEWPELMTALRRGWELRRRCQEAMRLSRRAPDRKQTAPRGTGKTATALPAVQRRRRLRAASETPGRAGREALARPRLDYRQQRPERRDPPDRVAVPDQL